MPAGADSCPLDWELSLEACTFLPLGASCSLKSSLAGDAMLDVLGGLSSDRGALCGVLEAFVLFDFEDLRVGCETLDGSESALCLPFSWKAM